jgi:hypothetical protein
MKILKSTLARSIVVVAVICSLAVLNLNIATSNDGCVKGCFCKQFLVWGPKTGNGMECMRIICTHGKCRAWCGYCPKSCCAFPSQIKGTICVQLWRGACWTCPCHKCLTQPLIHPHCPTCTDQVDRYACMLLVPVL